MALSHRILAFFGHLPQPDLTPGPWFRSYVSAWAAARNLKPSQVDEYLTSGIVDGTNGWIWITATPEWDMAWFNSRGLAFPKRWIPWAVLDNYRGEPGEYIRLDL